MTTGRYVASVVAAGGISLTFICKRFIIKRRLCGVGGGRRCVGSSLGKRPDRVVAAMHHHHDANPQRGSDCQDRRHCSRPFSTNAGAAMRRQQLVVVMGGRVLDRESAVLTRILHTFFLIMTHTSRFVCLRFKISASVPVDLLEIPFCCVCIISFVMIWRKSIFEREGGDARVSTDRFEILGISSVATQTSGVRSTHLIHSRVVVNMNKG